MLSFMHSGAALCPYRLKAANSCLRCRCFFMSVFRLLLVPSSYRCGYSSLVGLAARVVMDFFTCILILKRAKRSLLKASTNLVSLCKAKTQN